MKKVEVSCDSECIHDKDDFITCLKIKSFEFAKAVQPFYEEMDWKWVIFKKDPAGSSGYYVCEKKVPSIEEIKECCHDLLGDMKKNGYMSLGTGGVVIELNGYGGLVRFNYSLRLKNIKREKRQRK